MARKSRKNLPQPEQATVSVQFPELDEEKIPTAIYGRLSVEDDEDNESMETQIALVQDFINRSSELNYVDTYFDNGFTGTNFKRPAFTRLMNDVRQKKIKCIVVKDLSRFGRNYLEAGYYIETVFPFLGVRLIAVTDHFDSTRKEDMESLALPIRNMVNTMYAKDISKKVWTSLQRKKEAGYAVGSDAPFGYIRNPVTKRNEIDPETAFYVQLIFQWVLMGVAIFEIARRLTLLKVPTPREWHRKIVEGKEVVTYKKWGETSVRHKICSSFSSRAFSGVIFEAMNWKWSCRYQCRGICRGEENAKFLIFELDESRILIRKNQYEQIENRSMNLKCRLYRSKWVQSIAASDVMESGQVVENPMIGAIPSRNEVQRELDDLLMSM